MGFFSFKTQDTNRSIANIHQSKVETFKVVMHDNKGNKWIEENYDGYGDFGGKDFFELLAEMNGKTDREEGIDLYYSDEPFLSPNLTQTEAWTYVNAKPKNCKFQGFFY